MRSLLKRKLTRFYVILRDGICVSLANSKRSFQWNTVIFQIKFHELQKIKMDCKMSIWNVYPKINVTLFLYWYAKCSTTRPVIGVIQCSFRNYQCWICVFSENLFRSRISHSHFKWIIYWKTSETSTHNSINKW